ncbi:MAG: hypothetical protein ACE361_06775 [Aureliella sp.]
MAHNRRTLGQSLSRGLLFAAILCTCGVVGCQRFRLPRIPVPLLPPPPIEVPVANPSRIGIVDEEFLWRMVVDSVDDFFRIESELPVRRNETREFGGKLTTYPEISGTILEPWRRDSARGFERIQSTFQTIRRRAIVDVQPEPTGYLISVRVVKEQENVDQSQFAAAGAATQRNDGSVVRNENQARQLPVTLGWIEIGRDRDLERRIMEGILGRITNVEPPSSLSLLH